MASLSMGLLESAGREPMRRAATAGQRPPFLAGEHPGPDRVCPGHAPARAPVPCARRDPQRSAPPRPAASRPGPLRSSGPSLRVKAPQFQSTVDDTGSCPCSSPKVTDIPKPHAHTSAGLGSLFGQSADISPPLPLAVSQAGARLACRWPSAHLPGGKSVKTLADSAGPGTVLCGTNHCRGGPSAPLQRVICHQRNVSRRSSFARAAAAGGADFSRVESTSRGSEWPGPDGPAPGTRPAPPAPLTSRPFRRNAVLDLVLWRIRLRDFVATRLGGDELTRRAALSLALLLLTRAGRVLPLRVLPGCGALLPVAVTAAAAAAAAGVGASGAGGVAAAGAAASDDALREILLGSSGTDALGLLAESDAAHTGLSLFSLGIGPYIGASMLMQLILATRMIPYLNVLHEEGAQGQEALENITSVLCFFLGCFFGVATVVVSPQCPRTAGSVLLPSLWLALGGSGMRSVSSQITKHGLGEGTSLLVALDILSGFVASVGPSLAAAGGPLRIVGPGATPVASLASWAQSLRPPSLGPIQSLPRVLAPTGAALWSHVSGLLRGLPRDPGAAQASLAGAGARAWEQAGQGRVAFLAGAALLSFLAVTGVTALFVGAVRRVPLKYFDFESPAAPFDPAPATAGDSGAGAGIPSAESAPHVPFPILPTGMYPLFAASMLSSFAGTVAMYIPALRGLLSSVGAQRAGSASSVFAFALRYGGLLLLVVLLNTASMDDTLKEISENLVSIGARVPRVLPGTATTEFLREARDSARFLGGVLLAATTGLASVLDHLFWSTTGIRPGFPSLLIIVGTVIALRRSVEAHQQIPKLLAVLEAKFQANKSHSRTNKSMSASHC